MWTKVDNSPNEHLTQAYSSNGVHVTRSWHNTKYTLGRPEESSETLSMIYDWLPVPGLCRGLLALSLSLGSQAHTSRPNRQERPLPQNKPTPKERSMTTEEANRDTSCVSPFFLLNKLVLTCANDIRIQQTLKEDGRRRRRHRRNHR